MKLKAFIEMRGISVVSAAGELKKPQQTVHLWVSSARIPRKAEMQDIYLWSGGMVEPNDFYDLPKIDDGRANGHSSLPAYNGAAA